MKDKYKELDNIFLKENKYEDKDDDFDWLRNDLLEKLEFDLEIGGVI